MAYKQDKLKILFSKLLIFAIKNIKYADAFGTTLGAKRHKDFILWDNDIDV